MRNPSFVAFLSSACLLALASPAAAQTGVTFRGYGTLGVVHSDNDRADYLVDPFKPNGPGRSGSWSGDVDSRLGVQANAQIAPGLSGVLQVLSQQRYDNSYRPVVEWANLKYEFTPDFSVRAGRIVLPAYMLTDSRRVGYTNPWVRPPVEVYSMVPVTSSDGADATLRFPLGDALNSVQVTVGRSDSRFPAVAGFESGTAKARRLFAVIDTIERGFATFRASYGQAALTIDAFDPLFDAFRQFGPPGEEVAARNELKDRRVTFAGLGASYDPGSWFAMAEWARFDTHSVLSARQSWYASAGYRLGAVTPYATFGQTRNAGNRSDPGLSLAGLPPPLLPAAAGLNGALNAQRAAVADQRTVSVGLRWDFLRNAALKLQYDEVRPQSGSPGTFRTAQPGVESPRRTRLFSAAVDFVF